MRRLLAIAAIVTVAACGQKTEAPAKPVGKKPSPQQAQTSSGELTVGSVMPAYTAKRLDGSTFDIQAERGNVLFLNLWATWCGPCRFEIPELQKLHERYAGQGLKMIGVSVDEGQDAANEIKAFAAEQKMTYPIVLDPDAKLANMFQTTVLPTSAIVDRTGKIVWKHFGIVSVSDQKMIEALQKALKG